ncbi:MAG: hypothetical protein ACM359_02740 [Bacillota bacterium]
MPHFRKSSYTRHEFHHNRHRFEHWYRNNTVYFITSKVRDGFPAFSTDPAKSIFWDRFNHYTALYGFIPWVTTLMNNHYHTLGYLRIGPHLGQMMRQLHGSIAHLVLKHLGIRHVPFWRSPGNQDYFDGCIRDPLQAQRAYRYTLLQSARTGLVQNWQDYPHTRVNVDMTKAIARAQELHAFLTDLPYPRYTRSQQHGHQR